MGVLPINHWSTKYRAKYSNKSNVLRRNSQEKHRNGCSSHESTKHQNFKWHKFAFRWHKKELPGICQNYFQYADQVDNCNTRYALKQNFYKRSTRKKFWKIVNPIYGSGKIFPIIWKTSKIFPSHACQNNIYWLDSLKVDHIRSFLHIAYS